MTWYDHTTGSIWSQPWGRAIAGELKGTQLQLIPFSLVPWETWLENHPDTLALNLRSRGFVGHNAGDIGFVIGVAIGEWARGYYYDAVSKAVIAQDRLGDIPMLVYVDAETADIHVFIRQLSDGTELTFSVDGEYLIDEQTNSRWDPTRGLALEGDLRGEGLREIPYISSFDWAWLDFYPQSDFYGR